MREPAPGVELCLLLPSNQLWQRQATTRSLYLVGSQEHHELPEEGELHTSQAGNCTEKKVQVLFSGPGLSP